MTTAPNPTGWQTVVKTAGVFWKDFRERALSTFWQGFVAVFVLAQPTTSWSAGKAILISALMGGAAAVLSMAKSLIVRQRGVSNSASSSSAV